MNLLYYSTITRSGPPLSSRSSHLRRRSEPESVAAVERISNTSLAITRVTTTRRATRYLSATLIDHTCAEGALGEVGHDCDKAAPWAGPIFRGDDLQRHALRIQCIHLSSAPSFTCAQYMQLIFGARELIHTLTKDISAVRCCQAFERMLCSSLTFHP